MIFSKFFDIFILNEPLKFFYFLLHLYFFYWDFNLKKNTNKLKIFTWQFLQLENDYKFCILQLISNLFYQMLNNFQIIRIYKKKSKIDMQFFLETRNGFRLPCNQWSQFASFPFQISIPLIFNKKKST